MDVSGINLTPLDDEAAAAVHGGLFPLVFPAVMVAKWAVGAAVVAISAGYVVGRDYAEQTDGCK